MKKYAHVVVIVVDRLGAAWLGPYGNAWIGSPQLNRLAAESVLAEFVVGDSTDLLSVYRSYFTGLPSICTAIADWPTLPQLARQRGYQTTLVTDCADLAHHAYGEQFDDTALLAWNAAARPATSSLNTRNAEVLAAAREVLEAAEQPTFLWIHLGGLATAWDAPYEFRERLCGDDDPEPPTEVTPPEMSLAPGYDPDSLLGGVHCYAAELAALDDALGAFVTAFQASGCAAMSTLAFTSPRGYALGEHLQVGKTGDALRGEILQLPLLLRLPEQAQRLTRLATLHQPADLYATLVRLIAPEEEPSGWGLDLVRAAQGDFTSHAYLASNSSREFALRMPHWFFRREELGDTIVHQLYAKPDDRWEANEISNRAGEIVIACDEFRLQILAAATSPSPRSLPSLPDILRLGRR